MTSELARNNMLPRARIEARIRRGIAKANLTPPVELPDGFGVKGGRLKKAPRRKSK